MLFNQTYDAQVAASLAAENTPPEQIGAAIDVRVVAAPRLDREAFLDSDARVRNRAKAVGVVKRVTASALQRRELRVPHLHYHQDADRTVGLIIAAIFALRCLRASELNARPPRRSSISTSGIS